MTIRTRPIRRLAVLAVALAVAPLAARAQLLKDLNGAVGAVTGGGGLP